MRFTATTTTKCFKIKRVLVHLGNLTHHFKGMCCWAPVYYQHRNICVFIPPSCAWV